MASTHSTRTFQNNSNNDISFCLAYIYTFPQTFSKHLDYGLFLRLLSFYATNTVLQ